MAQANTTDVLRVHRVRAGLTQAELAERIGVRTSTISDYENGKQLPNGLRLQQIAHELGISSDDIDLSRYSSSGGGRQVVSAPGAA